MQLSHLETKTLQRRKKVKAINALAVTTGDHIILFQPKPGQMFLPEKLMFKVRLSEGTFTDAPNVLLDNGTDGDTHVADVALSTTQDAVQVLTIATARPVTYDAPLRLKITDAPAGGTAIKVDFIGFFHELSD